jgi:type I restriction enzyme S subunit
MAAWEAKPLGDLCEFQRGLTYGKSDEVDSSSNVVLRANNVDLATHTLDLSDLRYISDAVSVPAVKRVCKGSLLICTASGSKSHLGKVAYVDEDYGYAFGGFMGQITPSPEIDGRYLFHALTSPAYKAFIEALSDGVNINNLKFGDLRQFPVPVPDLATQRRIAAILDEAFEGIATAKANAEKNLQSTRELFESHLQSVFTERGEGWVVKPLGTLCDLISGQHIDAKDYNTEGRGVGYLTGPSDFGVLNPVITKWSEHPKRTAKAGDILVTAKGSGVGKINLLDLDEVAISRQLMAVRVTATDVSYLYAFLSTKFDYFQSLSSGAAIPGISREDVLNLACPMPPPKIQQAIVELIHTAQSETQRLESLYQQKFAALDELKRSLLHKAFSGQL